VPTLLAKGLCCICGSDTGPLCINLGLNPLGGMAIFFGGIAGTAKVALGPLLTGSFGIGALAKGALANGALALGLCTTFFFGGLGGGTALVL
jgi:hypothetical protein